MPDGGDKPKPGIPSWQRDPASGEQQASDTNTSDVKTSEASSPGASTERASPPSPVLSESDQALLSKAMRFLRNEDIRPASLDSKVKFLEAQGLANDMIKKAIDQAEIDDYYEATKTPTPKASPPPQAPPAEGEQPLILTYPEFAPHLNQPPPIVTVNRLVNTAYVALGTAALAYGTSKYLVQPMAATLNTARHNFAQHTQAKLDELNKKLLSIVSVDPKTNALPQGGEGEMSGSESDPTELFHRDYGTQTSAEMARTNSSQLTSDSEDNATELAQDQVDKIKKIKQLCGEIIGEEQAERDSLKDISTTIKVLSEQLDSMAFPRQPYPVGVYGLPPNANAQKKPDDELTKLRNEIRGMKGTLLSARNFPAGAGRSRDDTPLEDDSVAADDANVAGPDPPSSDAPFFSTTASDAEALREVYGYRKATNDVPRPPRIVTGWEIDPDDGLPAPIQLPDTLPNNIDEVLSSYQGRKRRGGIKRLDMLAEARLYFRKVAYKEDVHMTLTPQRSLDMLTNTEETPEEAAYWDQMSRQLRAKSIEMEVQQGTERKRE